MYKKMYRARVRERSIQPDIFTFQKSVLHVVSAFGNIDSAEVFLDAGADLNTRDRFGQTPLTYAITGRKHEMIKLLIKKGADFDLPDNDGKLPLTFSIINNDLEAAKILVESGAAINLMDKKGTSPLHVAAVCSNNVMELLLDEFKKKEGDIDDLVNLKDAKGRSLLMCAVNTGAVATVRSIMHYDNIDVNLCDNSGHSPLIAAAQIPHTEANKITKELLENSADPNYAEPGNGMTALHFAVGRRLVRMDVVKMLIDAGANIDAKDNRGYTPLMHALRKGYQDVAKHLISINCDVTAIGTDREDAIVLALHHNLTDLLPILINAGCRVSGEALAVAVKKKELQDLIPWLKELFLEPPSLYCCCRQKIRKCLGSNIKMANELPVPPIIVSDIELDGFWDSLKII